MRSASMRPLFGKLALLSAGFLLTVVFSGVVASPELLAKKKDQSPSGPNEQKRAMHALNRLAFGGRPGDLQQVMAMGVDRWIDLQLHPEKIQDSAAETRVASLRTLRMNSREIAEEFPDGAIIRQVMDGKRSLPSDPARRAVYQVQIARQRERDVQKNEAKLEASDQPAQYNRNGNDRNSNDRTNNAHASSDGMNNESRADNDSAMSPSGQGGASDGAKTAEELAAAAAARPDAAPATASDYNTVSVPAPSAASTSTSGAMANNSDGAADNGQSAIAEMTGSTRASANAKPAPMNDPGARAREDRLYADLDVQKLPDVPPDQRYRKVLAMSVEDQVAFADSLRGGKGQDFLNGLEPKQKETLLAMNNPQAVITDELMQAKVLRSVYSERQLEEVMTDFWFNHFNVFINKGADRVLITSYERDVIRPRALGKFEDLLVATAKSPAMLFYLDNWLSVGPNSMQALGIPARPRPYGPYGFPRYPGPNPNAKRKQNAGLNENYGRELMELHTLSVNGGYSQRDVTEVAKVFTGWTIDKPNEGGGFQFDPRKHEPGPKFVLGHRIKPRGEDEGMEILHMLATSPQTAHFISLKLAQRFVSDDPPPALVDRMAKTFQKNKGDIRSVLDALFHSPEFWDDSSYRAKVKTPLEFVVSAVRATGADVEDAMPLCRQIGNMGMPLYQAQPPTGYSMKAETWVGSSALLNRMNFALALTSGKIRGVKVDAMQLAGAQSADASVPPFDAAQTLSAMEGKLLAADVSKQTHDSIIAQVELPAQTPPRSGSQADAGARAMMPDNKPQPKPASAARPPDVNMIAGLLLGSPEFQRR
jgi:uncharacterized protein (DUF1800 family)